MRKNYQLNEIYGRRVMRAADLDARWPRPAEFMGLELEVENLKGWNNGIPEIDQWWKCDYDGSLVNGNEFILKAPAYGADLSAAVDALFSGKITYTMSERTSFHVHINMQDGLSVEQLRAMFAFVYCIEPAIFRLADENRKWCNYCCPLTDMSWVRLLGFLNADPANDAQFDLALRGVSHEDKYFGFNISSYKKHGTVEFRYFPCVSDKATAELFIKLVQECKTAGLACDDLPTLLNELSMPDKVKAYIGKYMPHSGDAILAWLDAEDAAARARCLNSLIEVPMKEVLFSKNTAWNQMVESKGMTIVLNNLFPAAAERAPVVADPLEGQAVKATIKMWDDLINQADKNDVQLINMLKALRARAVA